MLLFLYPHQLFSRAYLPPEVRVIWLIEDPLFFHDPVHAPRFHRQKLILHRATLRWYADQLSEWGYRVQYWAYSDLTEGGAPRAAEKLLNAARQAGFHAILVYDPVDYLLERRLRRAAEKAGVVLHFLETPAFLTTRKANAAFFAQQRRYHQTTYYIWQRKRLGILLDARGAPQGGRWTYDTENRQRLPQGTYPPPLPLMEADAYVKEATAYVQTHFPQAWGAEGPWWLPTSHQAAAIWLKSFLQDRFHAFGPYEDAFEPEEPFLFHSVLSPLLNIGLLTPEQVLRETLAFLKENPHIPLPSSEGFIRQIIGWREYIRAVYDLAGTTLRKSNHWNHQNDFPAGWADAQTGILPIDTTLRRLYRWGYTHHIERLMVLGAFLFLHEVHPDRVYQFFMQSYVDAYDWVMVPNVYGMSQHASPLITTKPYFGGSRYLRSMSHYPAGPWVEAWDTLFWEWIRRHRHQLSAYPRLRPLLRNPRAQ